MAKTKKRSRQATELDSVFFLKLVMYLVLGSLWLRFTGVDTQLPVPIGLMIGLVFASHEHFQIDRKIELALLLLATFVGFWLPIGVNIVL